MHLGYIKKSLCLLILLVFISVINGQAIKNCKIRFDKDVHSDIIASGRSVVINYSLPEIDLTGFSNDNGSFYRISAPGHILTSDPGKPELPVFSRLVSVPGDGVYEVRITGVRKEKRRNNRTENVHFQLIRNYIRHVSSFIQIQSLSLLQEQ